MDNRKMNQLADDVHLIAVPFRWVGETLKLLFFILALPVVFVLSVIYWLITGTPIMSPDEVWLTKILLTIFSPFIATVICIFHKHWRRMRNPEYRNPIPAPVVFVITFVLVLAFVKCNFYFGWDFYSR